MIVFYGKIGVAGLSPNITSKPELNCAEYCYQDPLCMAHAGSIENCSFYSLDYKQKLDTANQAAGEKQVLGIKTKLPEDTCPINYTSVNFQMVSPKGEVHPWKLGANGLWIFRICKEGWQRFERSNNRTVCIKYINQTGITKARLGEICWYTYSSYVAGVQSVEESLWMREEADKYLPSNSGPMNYWTSGMRDGTCVPTDPYDKKIKFVWGEEYTTGVAAITEANSVLSCKECLVIMGKMPNRTQVISDYSCGDTALIGGGFCVYDMYK